MNPVQDLFGPYTHSKYTLQEDMSSQEGETHLQEGEGEWGEGVTSYGSCLFVQRPSERV